MLDALGRPILPNGAKAQIQAALARIPSDKRGALVIFADQNGARAHLAARIGDKGDWKVAGGLGTRWYGSRQIESWVSVEGSW